ncbi:MAG TPA: hypothetical protein VHB54_03720 [Mucilaginibacter sp.]|nr:hypothetical protein [Mucilaginibacter sp.]
MRKLLLCIAAAFMFASCQKNSTPSVEVQSLKTKNLGSNSLLCSPYTPGVDVYISDDQAVPSNSELGLAGYYKNGVFIRATTDTLVSTSATAVTVSGNDVYVTGSEVTKQFPHGQAAYWKNGVTHLLNYGLATGEQTSVAYDLAVSGSDVYVIGVYTDPNAGHSSGIIWKNGVAHNLDFAGVNTFAYGLAVNGPDIYISGTSTLTSANNLNTTATLWKNDVPKRLTCTGFSASGLFGITISGTDVYVTGITYPAPNATTTAVYWKNGVQHFLGSNAIASDIAVNGGYAYVVGTQLFGNPQVFPLVTQAIYWKNDLSTFHNTQNFFGAKGGNGADYEGRRIVFDGSDLYLTAFQNPYLYLYKNGIPIRIATSQGAYGKLVVVHH